MQLPPGIHPCRTLISAMEAQSLVLFLLSVALVTLLPAEATHGPVKLPSFIRKCSIKDPNVEKCVMEAGREAIPQFVKGDPATKIPPLDPLLITEVHIQAGSEPSALEMSCRNIVLKGLAKTELVHVGVDLKYSTYRVTCRIPRLEIDADYKIDGRVLLLPIKGNGKANFTFENATVFYEQKYSLKKRGDRMYLNLLDSTGSFNCSRAYIHLDNLFGGNEQLGSNVNNFLNENWHQLVDDLGQPFVDAAVKFIRQFGVTIVGDVPYDEIWDDVEV